MPRNYLNSTLFIFSAALLMVSCSDTKDIDSVDFKKLNEQKPYVLIIKHRSDEYSIEISNQVAQALNYTKLPYKTLDLGFISDGLDIPPSTKSIVITSYLIHELNKNDIEELIRFAAKGNSIVFTSPVAYDNFAFLQGIKPNTDYATDNIGFGVFFDEKVFPGLQEQAFLPRISPRHSGLKREIFTQEVKVLASAATAKEVPVILSNKIGLGEVITFNSYIMSQKHYRGLIFSAILRGLNGVPYSVANISTIFLDDFPAPLYNQRLAPIDEEYDLTHAQFVAKIWWPDIKALADTFDIRYSAMAAFNYNSNVVPPFDFQEWVQGSIVYNNDIVDGSIFIARDVKESRHELAFHGYNHFSLVKEEWSDVNFMVSALQAARKRWRVDNLGPLPTNYVPPTNHIDSIGIQAIQRGLPSIKYMSSLYLGDVVDGGGREFGPEPYAPASLFDYPRITSGFTMNENSLFNQQSLQLLTGIWTHFIHPDDVFQVTQRDEDEFESRNPLGLGWKSGPEHDYGLYDIFRQRILFNNEQYPLNKYITASEGGAYAQDWTNRLSLYTTEGNFIKLYSINRNNYSPKSSIKEKHWFMYVKKNQTSEVEPFLEAQHAEYGRSQIWDGYLYQFQTERDSLTLPDLSASLFYDENFLARLVQDELSDYQNNLALYEQEGANDGGWRDTRLEDAIRAYKRNPDDRQSQERLIGLSIEFGEVDRAIQILEQRLLKNAVWKENDINRLITYYGWEGEQARAESFLERLWEKDEAEGVITIKEQAVAKLGLYGEEFEKRWQKRELNLNPDDSDLIFRYIKSIETQENWPEVKQNLQKLLRLNPGSDSLYAYTLQRSIYYDIPENTLALLEGFPISVYPQLQPFASNIAFIYAYEIGDLNRALFWANKAPDFDKKIILEWLAELNLYTQFQEQATQLLQENPSDAELRNFIGTRLFYEGFREESFKIMYPLFLNDEEENTQADTLIKDEIRYLDYERKKQFYLKYPEFFTQNNYTELRRNHRWYEGPKTFIIGEYREDNFDNSYARGGIGVQFGNRRKVAHAVKVEDLFFSDVTNSSISELNYTGAGYEMEYHSANQEFTFRGAPSFLLGNGGVLPELQLSASYSHDSTFTSAQFKYDNVLTSRSIQLDINRFQFQFYREDYWAKGFFVTSFAGTGRYYTNEVYEYEGYGRVYIQPGDGKFRFRPIAELSYADATKSYISGTPYYTPDDYFSQGLGFDLRFRNPNSYEYKSLLSFELMGKHEIDDGIFFTGRAQIEHKLNNFWEINFGSDISTSSLYRSNRFFFTISYYFPRKLNPDNE